jgi:hypothetical protein
MTNLNCFAAVLLLSGKCRGEKLKLIDATRFIVIDVAPEAKEDIQQWIKDFADHEQRPKYTYRFYMVIFLLPASVLDYGTPLFPDCSVQEQQRSFCS